MAECQWRIANGERPIPNRLPYRADAFEEWMAERDTNPEGSLHGFELTTGGWPLLSYRLAFSICSACFSEVSVSLAPLTMRAISRVRSS